MGLPLFAFQIEWFLGMALYQPFRLLCLRRVHFCTHKSGRKKRQPPSGWTPAFVQSVWIGFDTALPLKQRFLASDLWRVARPASAVALLKRQANLSFVSGHCVYQNCAGSRQQKRNAPQPEGRQPKPVVHRTDYEEPGAPRRLSGCAEFPCRRPIGQNGVRKVNWPKAKRGWPGPGEPRRRFHPPTGGRLRGQPPHGGGS